MKRSIAYLSVLFAVAPLAGAYVPDAGWRSEPRSLAGRVRVAR